MEGRRLSEVEPMRSDGAATVTLRPHRDPPWSAERSSWPMTPRARPTTQDRERGLDSSVGVRTRLEEVWGGVLLQHCNERAGRPTRSRCEGARARPHAEVRRPRETAGRRLSQAERPPSFSAGAVGAVRCLGCWRGYRKNDHFSDGPVRLWLVERCAARQPLTRPPPSDGHGCAHSPSV